MTLREWAEREGLLYLYIDITGQPALVADHNVAEAVLACAHCWDCASWYVSRSPDGKLFRTSPDGVYSTGSLISEEELERTTRGYWPEFREGI